MPQYTPYTLGGPNIIIKKRNPLARNMPMKRKWPTSFAVPMQISNPTTGRGTRRRYNTRSGGRGGYSGPYRVLSSASRHTNPVYPRPEVKYIDISQAGAAPVAPPVALSITNVGTAIYLNAMDQGVGTNLRVGARISVKSVAYRFELDLPAGATKATSGRVVLLWDRQNNTSALPAWASIFSIASYLSFMNVGFTERYVILRNQQFSLSPNGDQSLFFEGYCKINMETVFPQASTTGGPTTGALIAMWISDQSAVADQPTIAGIWRTRFIDC